MVPPTVPTKYFFRSDDRYRGGPVGRSFGIEADAADIQDIADHILIKEDGQSSRFTSFTTETRVARRFTAAPDHRHIRKIVASRLFELEAVGHIRIIDADLAFAVLKAGDKKQVKKAADVRASMRKNSEVLIEGVIQPEDLSFVS